MVELKVEILEASCSPNPANSVELHFDGVERDVEDLESGEVRLGHKVACVIKRTSRQPEDLKRGHHVHSVNPTCPRS